MMGRRLSSPPPDPRLIEFIALVTVSSEAVRLTVSDCWSEGIGKLEGAFGCFAWRAAAVSLFGG